MSVVWAWLVTYAGDLLADYTLRLAAGAACLAIAALLLAVVVIRTRRRRAARRMAITQPLPSEPTATPAGSGLTSSAAPQQTQPVAPSAASPELEPRRPLASHPLRDREAWRIEAAGPGSTQPGAPAPILSPAESVIASPVALQTQVAAREVLAVPAKPQLPTRPASAALEEPARDERAEEMYRRALALLARNGANRAQALRDALACFRQTQEVWTRERAPERWAAIQNDIGRIYQELPDGDRASHLHTAIMYHQTALEVFDPVTHSMNWAWTQAALGAAYQNLPAGSSIVNARAAVAYFQRALDVFSRENAPLAWAWNQNNLGAAYDTMRGGGAGERVARLRDAARCYEAALDVYTVTEYPAQHRVIARNLARVRAELRALE